MRDAYDRCQCLMNLYLYFNFIVLILLKAMVIYIILYQMPYLNMKGMWISLKYIYCNKTCAVIKSAIMLLIYFTKRSLKIEWSCLFIIFFTLNCTLPIACGDLHCSDNIPLLAVLHLTSFRLLSKHRACII